MESAFPANVMHFARILRRAGVPIGTGKVLAALEALPKIDLARREDVFWALHAVFVERHAQSHIFRLAFDRFWRNPAPDSEGLSLIDQAAKRAAREDLKPATQRIADAFADATPAQALDEAPALETAEAVASWSASEKLRSQDFETMSAAELSEAKQLIARLRLPIPEVRTRRFAPSPSGARIDMRRTLRLMTQGGEVVALARRQPRTRHPPLVVLCDISGSMASYSRMLLHFLHAVTNDRDRVHVFLFGTRLTNVTRELAHRDPDVALARVGKTVRDWSGGTRIGHTLAEFNRLWSRRVLGQGAITLLITDGLDRDGGEGLSAQMRRLQRSCRRLIWLNPLLRYAAFEPKSLGIQAMLPFVDEFRPVHNLDSLAGLIAALSDVNTARRELRSAA
ncbi:MAG: VWA domain-containing protein [Rhodospirillaceae bacterium]|nr:VWA domain-containing protein [Rhodospirillaceae bacterium]